MVVQPLEKDHSLVRECQPHQYQKEDRLFRPLSHLHCSRAQASLNPNLKKVPLLTKLCIEFNRTYIKTAEDVLDLGFRNEIVTSLTFVVVITL